MPPAIPAGGIVFLTAQNPGETSRRICFTPARVPAADAMPNTIAVPAPTMGSTHTIGAARAVAAAPTTSGAAGDCTAST